MHMSKCILLVDDNVNDAELTLMALAKTGKAPPEVVVTRDGEEALDYLYCRGNFQKRDQENPIVVLLDLKMPKVDGLEVLRQIKADANLKTIPVVMLTSSHETQDLRQCYQLGVNAYVVKPMEFNQFMKTVQEIEAFWCEINKPPPHSSGKHDEHLLQTAAV